MPVGFTLMVAGTVPLVLAAKKQRLVEWLQTNGHAVQADFIGAEGRRNITVNGRHPYRLSAQWRDPSTGQLYVFHSANVWTDPAGQERAFVTVLIDPGDPRRYWMDTSFLPPR